METIFKILDYVGSAYIFGATVWFFFIQSIYLIKKLGRDKFVPLQMMVVKVLFKSLFVASIMVTIGSKSNMWAIVTCIAVTINLFFILPNALKAGGSAMRENKGVTSEGTATNFADYGAGQSTKFYHRMVVLFVVIMLVGLGLHFYM